MFQKPVNDGQSGKSKDKKKWIDTSFTEQNKEEGLNNTSIFSPLFCASQDLEKMNTDTDGERIPLAKITPLLRSVSHMMPEAWALCQ